MSTAYSICPCEGVEEHMQNHASRSLVRYTGAKLQIGRFGLLTARSAIDRAVEDRKHRDGPPFVVLMGQTPTAKMGHDFITRCDPQLRQSSVPDCLENVRVGRVQAWTDNSASFATHQTRTRGRTYASVSFSTKTNLSSVGQLVSFPITPGRRYCSCRYYVRTTRQSYRPPSRNTRVGTRNAAGTGSHCPRHSFRPTADLNL